jgi:hypothetical protein
MPHTINADALTLASYLSKKPALVAGLLADTGWTLQRLRMSRRDLTALRVTTIWNHAAGTIRVDPTDFARCRSYGERAD